MPGLTAGATANYIGAANRLGAVHAASKQKLIGAAGQMGGAVGGLAGQAETRANAEKALIAKGMDPAEAKATVTSDPDGRRTMLALHGLLQKEQSATQHTNALETQGRAQTFQAAENAKQRADTGLAQGLRTAEDGSVSYDPQVDTGLRRQQAETAASHEYTEGLTGKATKAAQRYMQPYPSSVTAQYQPETFGESSPAQGPFPISTDVSHRATSDSAARAFAKDPNANLAGYGAASKELGDMEQERRLSRGLSIRAPKTPEELAAAERAKAEGKAQGQGPKKWEPTNREEAEAFEKFKSTLKPKKWEPQTKEEALDFATKVAAARKGNDSHAVEALRGQLSGMATRISKLDELLAYGTDDMEEADIVAAKKERETLRKQEQDARDALGVIGKGGTTTNPGKTVTDWNQYNGGR